MGGGVVESVAASTADAAGARRDGRRRGRPAGLWQAYPSGLAFTVTFASGVDMSGVDIDFSSPITSIISDARRATRPWSGRRRAGAWRRR